MLLYHNFIGIDIGKFTFVVALHSEKTTKEYENNEFGIAAFIKAFEQHLAKSLVVLETTGGYEKKLLLTLCNKNYKVHRANTRKVKSFIKSFGFAAKTDSLDAKALALYGFERYSILELFSPSSKLQYELYELAQRRKDLKQILVAEKNRLKAPTAGIIKQSCKDMIEYIANQIKSIDKGIAELIKGDKALLERLEMLKTIPGVGNITAEELLALLPELGTLKNKQITALAGLAPRANDSGLRRGYRKTGHGRYGIKPILFLSAMAARNCKSDSILRDFYNRLVDKGKSKLCVLTAVMHKIIVIANARLKELAMQAKTCSSC